MDDRKFPGCLIADYTKNKECTMTRKLFLLSAAVLFVLVSCKKDTPGKFDDIKEHLNRIIKMETAYYTALEQAKDGKDAAAAINKRTATIVALSKKLDAINKKHPEFEEKYKDKIPEELKKEYTALEELAKRGKEARQKE